MNLNVLKTVFHVDVNPKGTKGFTKKYRSLPSNPLFGCHNIFY